MKQTALRGLHFVASVFESILVDGIAGADNLSDSEKSESSDSEVFEFPEDVDETKLTRTERIQLRNQRERKLNAELNQSKTNKNGGILFKKENKKCLKELQKIQQKFEDEFGSEAYICDSECSYCATENHPESERDENEP